MRTLLEFENAVLDLFEDNRITLEGAKTVLWALLTAIYEDELIEEPHRRETIIENILVGQFEIGKIIRVNRKNDEHTISDKIFDFSRKTIQQLKESGYNNTTDLSDVEFS